MRVTRGNMQIQSKEGRADQAAVQLVRPSTQISSYGLDSTMNFDTLSVQHYKEVRGERKKYGSYCDCSMPSQAGKDRNKQGAGDCRKPRATKNA